MKLWRVTLTNGDDVTLESGRVAFGDQGALFFWGVSSESGTELVMAFAAGQWASVRPER